MQSVVGTSLASDISLVRSIALLFAPDSVTSAPSHTALEKVAELEPDWDGDRPELCRSLLHSVLRDVKLMERLGRLS